MQKNKVVFLIRSYNESARIVDVIRGIYDAGYEEILIVDDGSTDGTRELLEEHFHHKYHYVHHLINRGGGAALETGFEYIRRHADHYGWHYVVTFDADGQMNVDDMKKFHHAFHEDDTLDVAIGSRLLPDSIIEKMPRFRKFVVLILGRIFTKVISGNTPSDSHNGFRMLRVGVVREIHLTMDGFEYSSELIDEMMLKGFRWKDIPVHIRYDAYSLGKGQKVSNAINIALRMIYKKLF